MPAMACSVDPAGYAFAGDTALPDPSTDLDLDADFVAGAGGCSDWSPSRSSELYRIDAWGAPYFAANSAGNISVRPHGAATLPHQEIDLMKVVKKVSDPRSDGGLGLEPPLIVRFPDVLKNRLESLQAAFDFAVQSQGYGSHYQGVYPVKCNQDRFIVEDVVKFGSSFRFGLEAGSKPELLLSMSCLCKGSSESLLICNGFKDAEYVALAIVARKLDLNTVIVLEQEEELDLVIDLSKKLSVRPVIGLRAKLRTKHSGHFGATSGEKGKFGLTAIQIVRVVRKLDRSGMLDCLRLLHFHIGSQIPSTALLADGVGEAAQIYCELVRLGAPMQVIDVGGGLGIDYDGSRSGDSDASVGYEIDDYASAVVSSIRLVCDRKSVDHPVIVSESGRAIVSHHSILIFEAVSASSNSSSVDPPSMSSLPEDSLADYRNLTGAAIRGEYEACSAYADQMKHQCVEQFKDGSIAIEQLAAVDGLCELISRAMGSSNPVATYHINLSIFTSIPDFWAIGQLFPIVPIHRLQEQPQVRAILSDLTCDSDGKIDKFIGGESSLHLHDVNAGRYYLGMFLGGAYQEALGGFHNLFGGPSVVRAVAHGPGGFTVTRAAPGPSCGDVLRVARHEPELMFRTLKDRVEECEGDAVVVAGLVSGLARSFQNMPYLAAAGSSCCLTGFDNGGYSCNDDDDDGGEEERWPYSYA